MVGIPLVLETATEHAVHPSNPPTRADSRAGGSSVCPTLRSPGVRKLCQLSRRTNGCSNSACLVPLGARTPHPAAAHQYLLGGSQPSIRGAFSPAEPSSTLVSALVASPSCSCRPGGSPGTPPAEEGWHFSYSVFSCRVEERRATCLFPLYKLGRDIT